jgi:PAS domain S-box-containing protein
VARTSALRWRVITAAAVALALTAATLAIALTTAASARGDGRELSQRLVPAAASSVDLLSLYTAQQTALRDDVTAGRGGKLAPYRAATAEIQQEQSELAALIRSYPAITAQLAATEGAEQAWLAHVAAPQLTAAAGGGFSAAQALQADVPLVRPYVLAVRSRGAALQARIAATQRTTTNRLTHAQAWLLGALVGLCVVVAGFAVDALVGVSVKLLKPFDALRQAVDAVAHGDYETRIPVIGAAELAELGRSTELMRIELVTALAERERAEQRFRRLFDSAPDAMIAVSSDGSIVMANAQAVRLFGYPAPELLGSPVEMLVPEETRAAMTAERTSYFADPVPQPFGNGLKLPGLRRDGRRFPAEISLSGLPTDHGMLVTAAIRDVSERLAMERERERLRSEAEQERVERRLQQAQRLESLGQLVGGVAHDFNNLLNVIQGYADFVAEEIQPLAQADPRLQPVLGDIEQVRSAGQQAARLTRQLLAFARHEVNRPEVLDLNEAVSSAGQLLRRTLGEHIDLAITAEPTLWPVKADRGQLEQVLVNLAVNARDAMPGGGQLTIDTTNKEVDDAYAASHPDLKPGRYARLRVSDSGVGMDRATIARVFEPFFTTKPKGRGTGLGLATVYGVVKQAGGTIDIYSEPALGTSVSVLLPATDEDAAPFPRTAPPPDSQRGHGETILLVEDEESLRELTRRILMRNGYQVCAVDGGRKAVEVAREPGQPIDLLLTDVIMPEMLGNEVAAEVSVVRPDLPALYMSGYAQPILDSHGMKALSIDILEKPFTEADLLARVWETITRPVGGGPSEPGGSSEPSEPGGSSEPSGPSEPGDRDQAP